MSQLSLRLMKRQQHIEALLRVAEQQGMMGTENTRRIIQSQGAEFRWNPKMNDKDGPLTVVQSNQSIYFMLQKSLKKDINRDVFMLTSCN